MMQRVYDFLKKAGVYYLATVEGDQHRVRPFGTIDLYKDGLYIQTGRKKDCWVQMNANAKVELCAMLDGDWIRICAKAVEDEDIEAQKHMLEAYPSLASMYQPGDGNTSVLRLVDGVATIYSFKNPPVEIKF